MPICTNNHPLSNPNQRSKSIDIKRLRNFANITASSSNRNTITRLDSWQYVAVRAVSNLKSSMCRISGVVLVPMGIAYIPVRRALMLFWGVYIQKLMTNLGISRRWCRRRHRAALLICYRNCGDYKNTFVLLLRERGLDEGVRVMNCGLCAGNPLWVACVDLILRYNVRGTKIGNEKVINSHTSVGNSSSNTQHVFVYVSSIYIKICPHACNSHYATFIYDSGR